MLGAAPAPPSISWKLRKHRERLDPAAAQWLASVRNQVAHGRADEHATKWINCEWERSYRDLVARYLATEVPSAGDPCRRIRWVHEPDSGYDCLIEAKHLIAPVKVKRTARPSALKPVAWVNKSRTKSYEDQWTSWADLLRDRVGRRAEKAQETYIWILLASEFLRTSEDDFADPPTNWREVVARHFSVALLRLLRHLERALRDMIFAAKDSAPKVIPVEPIRRVLMRTPGRSLRGPNSHPLRNKGLGGRLIAA